MQEIWKAVKNYEGLYEVSNLGNVKSISYFNHVNNKSYPRNKMLKQIANDRNYLRVYLYKKGKGKNFRVHRLVADAFIPNPDNLPEVNHIDGNKQNNKTTNLEWCTHQHNMKEAYRLGLVKLPLR